MPPWTGYLVAGLIGALLGFLLARLAVGQRARAHDAVWQGRLSQAEEKIRARSTRIQQLEADGAALLQRIELKEAELRRRRLEAEEAAAEITRLERTLDDTQGALADLRRAFDRTVAQLAETQRHLRDSYSAAEQLQARAAAGESATGQFRERMRELEEMNQRLMHLDGVVEQLSAQAALVPLRDRRIRELEQEVRQRDERIDALLAELARLQARPATPIAGGADDLKQIHGIGPVLERLLHAEGVNSFRQIACWTETDVESFERRLPRLAGRIRRDDWIGGAARCHLEKYGARPAQDAAAGPATEAG